jgi:hypothetical protein
MVKYIEEEKIEAPQYVIVLMGINLAVYIKHSLVLLF